MNRRGFSLVELLASIAILGILSGLAMTAVQRYQSQAKQQAYDTLVSSAKEAAESYAMDHPSATSVNFDTLVNEGYLENAIDPAVRGENCTGTVRITDGGKGKASKLKQNDYTVYICCANYKYEIGDGKPKETDVCMADFNEEKYIEPSSTQPTNCSSGNTKTKSFEIYTMNYKGKVCEKDSEGKYGSCYDTNNPFGNINYPCRYYEYHMRKCVCTYSKNTNKYCSSKIDESSKDDHTMRVKYMDDENGINSCKSNDPSGFNSYVHDVCWYGKYSEGSNVMTFHGYRFYKGQAEGYTKFDPDGSWFHEKIGDGNYDIRVTRGKDVDGKPNYEQGCRDTCVRFTETLSGKVS